MGLVGRQVEFESHGLGGNHHLAIHPAGPSQEPHLPLVGQQAVVNPEIGHLHRRQFQAEVEVGLAAAHLDVQQGLEAMAGEEGQRRDLVRLGRRAGGLRQQGGLDLVEADHEVRLIRVVGINLELDGAIAIEGMAGEGHRQLVGLDDQVGAGEQLAVGKDQAPAQAALALEVQPRHVAGQQGQEIQVLHRQVNFGIELGQNQGPQAPGLGDDEGRHLDLALDRCRVGHGLGIADPQRGEHQVERAPFQAKAPGPGIQAEAAAHLAGQGAPHMGHPKGMMPLDMDIGDFQQQVAAFLLRCRLRAGLGIAVADDRKVGPDGGVFGGGV